MKTKKDIHLQKDKKFVDEIRDENTRCPKCGGILVSKFGPGITLTFCVKDNCDYEDYDYDL